ncbi:ATP-binding cassette sub-family G member 2 [Pelomyxa schiedti]|nr:ATP-binding cassette sub-family G member 2 [Pelomyxa schiedti]
MDKVFEGIDTPKGEITVDVLPGPTSFDAGNSPSPTPKGGVHVSVTDLSYSVREGFSWPHKKAKMKQVLHSVSFEAKPGRLLAVMGPSGSGKSSLLDVVSSRIDSKHYKLRGEILVNGTREPPASRRKIIAYLKQEDVLQPMFSVFEILLFAARIKLPTTVSDEEKIERANQIIKDLGLEKVMNSPIGSLQERGLSGGEMKRVALGIELITDPDVLFLDEPTSGLDSATALQTVSILKRLASRGKTIVCAIHQPRGNIFSMCDDLLLMNHGKVIYFGPTVESIPYFAAKGLKPGSFINPADFFLDVLCDMDESTSSTYSRAMPKKIAEPIEEDASGVEPSASVSIWTQFILLSKRQFIRNWRDPYVFWSLLFEYIFLAIFIGAVYCKLGDDQKSIQDRFGALFFVIGSLLSMPMYGILILIPRDRAIFNRERASGFYSTLPWLSANVLCDLPMEIFFSILFSALLYFFAGFNPPFQNFAIFTFLSFLLLEASVAIGLATGAIFPDLAISNLVVTALILILISFCGYVENLDSIPPYFKWISVISFLRWIFVGYSQNEFNGLVFSCDLTPCSSVGIDLPNCTIPCTLGTGEEVLAFMGLDTSHWWRWMMVSTVGACIVFFVGAYLALRFVKAGKT